MSSEETASFSFVELSASEIKTFIIQLDASKYTKHLVFNFWNDESMRFYRSEALMSKKEDCATVFRTPFMHTSYLSEEDLSKVRK